MNQQPTDFSLIKKALKDGKPAMLNYAKFWPQIRQREELAEQGVPDMISGTDNILARMAQALGAGIQFPASTAYVHGIGILASVMAFNFDVKTIKTVKDSKGHEKVMASSPECCNLYVATAQPPSTGKSEVNDAFANPAFDAFDHLNKKRKKELAKINAKIDLLKQEKKAADNPKQVQELAATIAEYQEEAEQMGPVFFTTDDGTPEGIDQMSCHQNGYFTVTSSEHQALESFIGGSYVQAGKTPNLNLALKGWDNERASTIRGGRKGNTGKLRGSVAVIAQDPSIDLILKLSKMGVGLSDRFLMYSEPNMLGIRDHSKGHFIMDPDLSISYKKMIHEMVNGGNQLLILGESYDEIVSGFLNSLEPLIAPGEKFSHPTIRGFYGKARKQIKKLSCVLHVAKEWGPGGEKKQKIGDETIREAVTLFRKFGSIYRNLADEKGAAGANTEREAVVNFITSYAERKKKYYLKNEQIRTGLKSYSAFKGQKALNKYLRAGVFNDLQDDGIIFVVGSGIYINPMLAV